MPRQSDRAEDAAAVLEAVAVLSRALVTQRRAPFHGRSLTGTQMQTLFLAAHGRGRITPGRVASELGITPGAVTQLVDGLRREGLVETTANPDDARSRVIQLTEDAAAEVRTFESELVERMLPRFAQLSDTELRQLARLIGKAADGGLRPRQ